MTSLATFLEHSAERYPDRTAIVHGATRLTYAQVDAAANQVANLLVSRGIQPGDRVALSCPNLPCFTVVYYGILKAGAVIVPLNVLLKGREVAYHLADSGARMLFAYGGAGGGLPTGEAAWEGFRDTGSCTEFFLIEPDTGPAGPAAAPVGALVEAEYLGPSLAEQPTAFETVRADDDDTAVILYTSGTTGRPKGAELRHRNMRDNALTAEAVFGVDASRPDTFLCALPLFHSFGQTVVQNTALAYGGTMVMLPRFDARAALDLMLSNRVTFFAGVPTMYWRLLGALGDGVDVASIAGNLRVAVSGGSALPVGIHREVEQRLGVTILEGYGLSETSPIASFGVWGEEPRIGSVGTPVPGVEMKLVNDDWTDVPEGPDAIGEIAIKGHNVFKGYHGRPEATAEAVRDGWFRSGDLARKDSDGFYYVVDRSKDMIIRGGYNVYPRELEEVLITHPGVSLVAVVGFPHESHGEEIKAVVVRKPGAALTEGELIAWGKAQFASYKYPRVVEFREALPMNATGKILKREIR
ncbi:long-chain-fatty-acid--CoA ligase [Streptomyces sp. NPDC055078]